MFASSIVQNGGSNRYRRLFSLTQLIQFFFFSFLFFYCCSNQSWHYKGCRCQLELWFCKMVVTLNLFQTSKNAHYAFMCFLVMGFPYNTTILWNFVGIISLSLYILGNGVLSCDIRLMLKVIMLCLQLRLFLSGNGYVFNRDSINSNTASFSSKHDYYFGHWFSDRCQLFLMGLTEEQPFLP
jgi:hypothetical protein